MKALSWCCYCWFEFRAWFRFHVIVVLCSGAEVQTWTKFANRLHLPPVEPKWTKGPLTNYVDHTLPIIDPLQQERVGLNGCTQYVPLFWPVQQRSAAVEHNTGRVAHISISHLFDPLSSEVGWDWWGNSNIVIRNFQYHLPISIFST